MVLYDSDSDHIFPKKLDKTRNKRGRKPTRVVNNYATSDEGIPQKNSSGRKLTERASNIEIFKNSNISEEKIVSDSNTHKILTRSKTGTISEEKDVINEVTTVENFSDTHKRKKNSRTKNSSNSKTKKLKTDTEIEIISKIEKKLDVQLETKTEKLKKDVLNCKTKTSINLRRNEIKSNTDTNDDELILNKSIDKDIINSNPISSLKINNKTRKTNKNILNGKVADKKETNVHVFLSNGTKSSIDHNIKQNNISSENKTNITNTVVQKSDHFTVPEPKRTRKTKIENSEDVRKSSRKRVSSSMYWLMNYEQLKNEQSGKEIKKSIKTTKKLETIDLPIEDKKTTKVKLKDLLKVDKKSSASLEKLKTDELPIRNKNLTTTPEKRKTNEVPVLDKKLIRTPEKTKTDEPPKEVNKTTQLNKKLSIKSKKSSEPKILTAGKIRKSLVLERRISKFSTPRKTPKKQVNLDFNEKDDYTTEEENDIPRDTLLSNIGIEGIEEFPNDKKGQKRKVESNIEIYQPKKVRLQAEPKFSFKKMALSADIHPAKAGGLADVQLDGKRLLLGCFGKYPRHCNTNPKNADISVGLSINNGNITTGVIEIEPAGSKNYEYPKKVDLLFVVLEGTAEVGIGNSSQVLRLGQDFYVPKDTPYYILNISNTDKLVIYFCRISKKKTN